MTLDESIQGLRLRVMRRAEQIGNVSQVCTEFGISRTLFYRWRRRFEQYGPDGLHPRRTQGRRGRPRQVAPETERLVQSVAISAGTWGCGRIAGYLARTWQLPWPPARSSGSCAGSAWPRAARGWRCSSIRRSRRWGCSPSGPPAPLARAPWPHAARGGPHAGRARLSRHLLRGPAQGRRQGLAGHGLRCLRRTGWRGCCRRSPRRPWRPSSAGFSSPTTDAPAGQSSGC